MKGEVSKNKEKSDNIWSKRLSSLIKDNELSVNQLAEKSGINRDMIYTYLSGSSTPGGDKLLAIATATGISLDWLAGRPGAAKKYGDEHSIASINAAVEEATGLIPVPIYEVVAGQAGRGCDSGGH